MSDEEDRISREAWTISRNQVVNKAVLYFSLCIFVALGTLWILQTHFGIGRNIPGLSPPELTAVIAKGAVAAIAAGIVGLLLAVFGYLVRLSRRLH